MPRIAQSDIGPSLSSVFRPEDRMSSGCLINEMNMLKKVWSDPHIKTRIQSGQGWNMGSQLTAQYRKGWFSRAELTFQHTQNSISVSFDIPKQYQLEYRHNEQYRLNTTLIPLGYTLKVKEYSISMAVGVGLYTHLSNQGSYSRWSPPMKDYGKATGWEKPYWDGSFYITQLQMGYKCWHIAANMNWCMQFPIDNYDYLWMNEGSDFAYGTYKYHTLDLRLGYQF